MVIFALALSMFAIGTTEFVVVGVIPDLATDLAVGIPTAGLLVSAYALAIGLGAPVLSALLGRFERRPLILALMSVFVLSNIVAALAPNFGLLLGARIVMAVSHGVFVGVAAIVATSAVPRDKVGGAVAVMFSGLTVAMVVGVPLGAWIGTVFSWRIPFLVVAGLGLIALAGLVAFIPKDTPTPIRSAGGASGVLSQLSVLANPRLLAVYGIAAFGFGGTFTVFTFLSPLLTEVTGVSTSFVSVALVIFGLGTVGGTLFGGRLSDRVGIRGALIVLLIATVAVLAALPLSAHSVPGVLVNLLVWGFFGFSIPPVVSSAVVAIAERDAPSSVGTASSTTIAALNLGVASGSFVGDRLLGGPGLLATPIAGAAFVAIAVVLTVVGVRRRPLVRLPHEQVATS